MGMATPQNPHIPIAPSEVGHYAPLVIPTGAPEERSGGICSSPTATDLSEERGPPLCSLGATGSLLQPAFFQHRLHAGIGSQPRFVHRRQIFRIPA